MGLFTRKLTIGELQMVDANRAEKANVCKVKLVKIYHELKPETLMSKIRSFFGGRSDVMAYYVIFKLAVTSDTGTTHTVFIKTNPDFDLENWSSNKVEIYCDCPDFKYRSAYNLNQHDSLFLNDKLRIALGSSLTDAPKTATKTTKLCKHAVAALNWVVSNYTSLMRTI